MTINTSMMQNFGLEDLSHVQSRRNLLKYLVRVEMASDWFTRFFGGQTRLRALLEPAINKKRESNESEHRAYRH